MSLYHTCTAVTTFRSRSEREHGVQHVFDQQVNYVRLAEPLLDTAVTSSELLGANSSQLYCHSPGGATVMPPELDDRLCHGFWATVCKTVRSVLSDRCLSVCRVCPVLSVLSVTLVYCIQTV